MTNVTATDLGAWLAGQGFINVDAFYRMSTADSDSGSAGFVISNFGALELSDKPFAETLV